MAHSLASIHKRLLLLTVLAGLAAQPTVSQPLVWSTLANNRLGQAKGAAAASSSGGYTAAAIGGRSGKNVNSSSSSTTGLPLLLVSPHGNQAAAASQPAAAQPLLPFARTAQQDTAQPLNVQQFVATCSRVIGDQMSQAVEHCDYRASGATCQQLTAEGRLPAGTQSYAPQTLTGNFSIPNGCSKAGLALQQSSQQLTLQSSSVPVAAVIVHADGASKIFYLRNASTQGKVNTGQLDSIEICLSPASSSDTPLYVMQSALYSLGLNPGSTAWDLRSSVQLPSAFSNGVVNMFSGDTVDAAWTLAVTKSGAESTYRGVVSGQITLSNNQPAVVAVYSIAAGVASGPTADIRCDASLPFKMAACSSTVCSFTAAYPQAPPSGMYQTQSTVNYQLETSAAVNSATGNAAFQVQTGQQQGLYTAAVPSGKLLPGEALLTDSNLQGQTFKFQSSGRQSFVTTLQCPASGTVSSQATLVAGTGQEVTASASITKNCHELGVQIGEVGTPHIARYIWTVNNTASVRKVVLMADSSAAKTFLTQQLDAAKLTGQDTSKIQAQLAALQPEGSTTAEVTYTVQFTKSQPPEFIAKRAPFSVSGTLLVTNSAPINAQLFGVAVTISDPMGGFLPYSVSANCPLLTVGSGQVLTCDWTAEPPFNPTAGQVFATARYINTNNGTTPSGSTKDFTSAPSIVGPGEDNDQDTITNKERKIFRRRLGNWSGASNDGSAGAFNPVAFMTKMWDGIGSDNHPSSSSSNSSTGRSSSSPVAVTKPKAVAAAQPPHTARVVAPTPAAEASPVAVAAPVPFKTAPPVPVKTYSHSYSPQNATFGRPQPVTSPGTAQPLQSLVDGLDSFGSQKAAATPGHNSQGSAAPKGVQPGNKPAESAVAGRNITAAAAADTAANNVVSIPLPGLSSSEQPRMIAQSPPAGATGISDSTNSSSGGGGSTSILASISSSSALAAGTPTGILDDCVDISGVYTGPGLVPGVISSGQRPFGHVCKSTTFVYNVRYGPVLKCSNSSKAVTAAHYTGRDSKAHAESKTEVTVGVVGCGAPVAVKLQAFSAVADAAYQWSLEYKLRTTQMQLAVNQTGNNTYTISYKRSRTAAKPRVQIDLKLSNPDPFPVVISKAMYVLNMSCPTGSVSQRQQFNCNGKRNDSNNGFIAAGQTQLCQLTLPLPCSGVGGKIGVEFTTPSGRSVAAGPFPFAAPVVQDGASIADSCVKVSTSWKQEPATYKAVPTAMKGSVPSGHVCESKSFQLTAFFGPFKTCGMYKALLTVSFKNSTGAKYIARPLDITIAGCPGSMAARSSNGAAVASAGRNAVNAREVQSAEYQGRSCIHQLTFWRSCLLTSSKPSKACDILKYGVPGGLGAGTVFFPLQAAQINRTYEMLLFASTSNAAEFSNGLYLRAAQAYVVAQLNQLTGVAVPQQVKEKQLFLAVKYFSAVSESATVGAEMQRQVADAVAVLDSFNQGKVPGVPACTDSML